MSMNKTTLLQRLQADKSPENAKVLMSDGQQTWEVDSISQSSEIGRKGGEASSGAQVTGSEQAIYLHVKPHQQTPGSQVGATAQRQTTGTPK